MASLKHDKVWGLFAAMDMKYELDRDSAKEPSLADMTSKAIELLAKNPNGFFPMIEARRSIGPRMPTILPAWSPTSWLLIGQSPKRLKFAKKDGHTAVRLLPITAIPHHHGQPDNIQEL